MVETQTKSEVFNKISRVLIVDDSKSMCAFLKKVIDADPAMSVVGCAQDAYEAREMIKALDPDILTLDVEMPKMDGLVFLKNIMRLRPMPVVMISSLTSVGSSVSLEALSIGAVDFMVKREIKSAEQLKEYSESIRSLVRSAATAVTPARAISGKIQATNQHIDMPLLKKRFETTRKLNENLDKVICIGASTGGPEAVKQVLNYLDIPRTAIVITQHMPPRFIRAFAERLNKNSRYIIETSYDGAPLLAGRCYVACGDSHTTIQKKGKELICKLVDSDRVNGHQPAVDVLFHSAAESLGDASVGILLTGMGNDGAVGLKAMHDKGAITMAQDEHSSAVWGMPGSAVRLDAVDAILPLNCIGDCLTELLNH